MSSVLGKSVFRISDQVRHKPDCTTTEASLGLGISDFGSRGLVYLYLKKTLTKALISYTVTEQLICAFAFAFAKSKFSYGAVPCVTW